MLFEKAEKKPSKVEKSPYLIKMFLKNAKFPTKKILINPPIIFGHPCSIVELIFFKKLTSVPNLNIPSQKLPNPLPNQALHFLIGIPFWAEIGLR